MLPGFHSPAASFDQPFEMLEACHDRVERTLRLLDKLVRHLDDHGADAAARSAARDVLRYFDQAAPHHHADEERHVFPAALRSGDPSLQAAVQRLQADHHAMEALWARLRVVLQDVAEGRCQRWPDADRANHDTEAGVPAARRSEVEAFLALYEQHIALEEGQVFPAARAAIDADSLAAMSGDMAARRGAAPPAPSRAD